MRQSIWRKVEYTLAEGAKIPRWALVLRAVLFPLKALHRCMGKNHGYQWETDTWLIEGVKYSGKAMRALANADGETYRIRCDGDCLVVEMIKPDRKGT